MPVAPDAWTLARYLERTARRSARAAIEDARLAEANDETSEGHELREAQDALEDAFRADMVAGRTSSVGQVETAPGELVAIPAEAWRHARIEWERSALSYPAPASAKSAKPRRASRVSMVSVRVRPWLHLPGVPALLDGLPLAVAFRRFVLDDPEVVAVLERAGRCAFYARDERTGEFDPPIDASMCDDVREGRFSSAEAAWPATFADRDLAVEWLAPMPAWIAALAPAARRGKLDWLARLSGEDRAAFQLIREAERVMRDRVGRFLEPLRHGEVMATGHHVGHGGSITLAPAIWSRPATRIDFVNGEVLLAGQSGPPTREWSGIMLSQHTQPTALPAASPAPPEAAGKSKGGRPPSILWDEAFDRLTEKLRSVGDPETGAALAGMMADCFHDMGAKTPGEADISKWLRTKHPRLWARVRSR